MSNTPTEILLEHIGWDYWGTVELMKKYPIINKFHWQYVCDPMDVDKDPDVANNITCIDDNGLDPWNRKMIPWKWRSFEEGICWYTKTPHLYLSGKKKYPYAERYTTIEGKHLKLYKRLRDF
jgi:hypothetical protein